MSVKMRNTAEREAMHAQREAEYWHERAYALRNVPDRRHAISCQLNAKAWASLAQHTLTTVLLHEAWQ